MTESPWIKFTRRTEDPKLSWLEAQLTHAGIPHRRNGESFHAPILEVHKDDEEDAWAILTPCDDVPDSASRFHEPYIIIGRTKKIRSRRILRGRYVEAS